MLNSRWRPGRAWIAALVCAAALAGTPALAGLSGVTQESTATGMISQVIPIVLDPSSGRQIAVWSEFDGVANKIAYARLENGAWADYHYLTFGPGQHTAPRIGLTRDGAFLFWIADGRRYVYAPVDLTSGRLHARPRRVPLETSGLHLIAQSSGMGAGTEGGTDVPVVTEECPPDDPECDLLSASNRDRRRQVGTEGGTDVPIVTEKCPPEDPDCELVSTSNRDRRRQVLTEGGTDVPVVVETESLWSVTSRPTCNLMILSIPSPQPGAYHLLKFESGRVDRAGQVRLLPGAEAGLPSATAASVLDSSCF